MVALNFMRVKIILLYVLSKLYWRTNCEAIISECDANTFPASFRFGAAISSYQSEGAWNVSGKGENIWDRFVHTHPENISNHSTGDVACDSYHMYKTDVSLLKDLGVDYYRFSLSWSRILPTGMSNNINQDGINYYNAFIDELISNNITPMVTIYHWDLPQPLQDLGGWTNSALAEYFKDFARVAYENFGDRVKTWITINEPYQFCLLGYSEKILAPAVGILGVSEYMCGHTVLLAHAKAYHLYDKEYRSKQGGIVGITLDSFWGQPATEEQADQDAADKFRQFDMGWFSHPIYSAEGDYPSIMRQAIDEKSKQQGFAESRLPKFSPSEIGYIRGSADFFGFNYYSTVMVSSTQIPKYATPSLDDDIGVRTFVNASWPTTHYTGIYVVPWGLRKYLNWIKTQYNNPLVLVTESGISTSSEIVDDDRISYIRQHLQQMLFAIHEDGCNVGSYTYWSLLDNFEWMAGYTQRFGLYAVNFTSPARERTKRKSAGVYAKIIESHRLPEDEDL